MSQGTVVWREAARRDQAPQRTSRLSALVTMSALVLGLGVVSLDTPSTSAGVTASVSPAALTSSGKAAERVRLPLVDATWVSAARKEKKFNRSPHLSVDKRQDNAYLKFDTSDLLDGKILSAKLRVRTLTTNATRGGLVVHKSTAAWSGSLMSFKNRPRQLRASLNSKPARARAGRWLTARLDKLKGAVEGSTTAFRLSSAQRSTTSTFARKGRFKPQLIVKFLPSNGSPPNEDKVFAHYFPPYPISIDNAAPASDYYARNYLTIDGEAGKHRSYGGLLRDRPLGRAPLAGDWRAADMQTEVEQARTAGIDGFTLDLLATSGRLWDISEQLLDAADIRGGFDVIPNLDASSSGITSQSPDQIADALAKLYAHPSASQIDGKYALSSFYAEGAPVSWWSSVISSLKVRHAIDVNFIAVFNNASDENLRAIAPISYAFGNWGVRTAKGALNAPNLSAKAHAMGKKWMSPVAFQDARPKSGTYAEAGNTETLRATWSRAISDGADFVQMATWNDYSESTSFAPSQDHGYALLDISHYFLDSFTYGNSPPITSDHLYLTHRSQPWAARATSGINNMQPVLGGSSTAPRDTVEALVFLTSAAVVTVTSGSTSQDFSLSAGMSAVTLPLRPGTQAAQITRGGAVVKAITSGYPVTDSPYVQDLQYVAAGS